MYTGAFGADRAVSAPRSLRVQNTGVEECASAYDSLIPEIFVKSPIGGRIQLTTKQAYYDAAHWEGVLRRLGNQRMIDSMTAPDAMAVLCVATQISVDPAKMFLARNYNYAAGSPSR